VPFALADDEFSKICVVGYQNAILIPRQLEYGGISQTARDVNTDC
jgi:hypothetical protein